MSLAEYVRGLRKSHEVKKHPTLEEVAESTDLSLSCIHNIETGIVTKPNIATLQTLAEYYKVPLKDFIEHID